MILGIDASRANRGQKTGVEWYAWHTIQEMKKIMPESVRVVLYTDTPLTGVLADVPKHWSVKILRWPLGRLWTQVRLSLEMLLSPPDVLWVPAHVFPIIHPTKTVMTVHDVAALRFPESYSRFDRWYTLWSARMALKKLWRVIVPSEFTKKELGTMGDTSNVQVIRHGYDRQYRQIEAAACASILQKYGITYPFFLSVGRLEEKKNTRRIIEAFNAFSSRTDKKYSLVLIGQPGYGYEAVQSAIQQSPYRERIISPGWVDARDIMYLMNATALFLFPSLYEGFGLPILESLACGTPVVAGRGSSLEEVGGDACLYVDPQSVEDIVRGMTSVLNGTIHTDRRRVIGLQRVEQYSWSTAAQATLGSLLL